MTIEEAIKQCEENEAIGLVELDTKQLANWLRELMQLRYNNAKSDYDEVRGRLQTANLIKDKIRDAVRYFNEEFEHLTDDEKASIKSLECLMNVD